MSGQSGAEIAIAAAAGLVGGAVAGRGLAHLLAVIPRGVRLPTRPLLIASALITALGAALTVDTPRVGLAVWIGLVAVGLGAIDLAVHRMPDALTLPAIPVTLGVAAVTQLLAPGAGSVLRGIAAGVLLFVVFGALSAISSRAMGLGDVKLVPSLGIAAGFLSWSAVLVAVMAAFVLGAAVAVIGIVLRRMSASSRLAFGPYLTLGCWLVLVFPPLAG
jgi:leader peptidase (prepilin peptidase)/N-methyltransferase